MNAYIYCADIYCEECGEAIRQQLRNEGKAPKHPGNESSYDSDQYPKGPFPDGGGECDQPQHCANQADCFNAIEFEDGHKVGVWLGNPLTEEGVRYTREMIAESYGEKNAVTALWQEYYAEELGGGPCLRGEHAF